MKFTKQNFLSISSMTHLTALLICLVCNYCINLQLTWSLIVALSLTESWIIMWAALSAKKEAVKKVLLIISITTIPYLVILSVLLDLPLVSSLGSSIAILSLIAIWIIYSVFTRYSKRIFLVIGISFLLSIPLSLGIVYLIKYFADITYTDFSSDFFHTFISLLLASISFLIDKKHNGKQP